MMFFFPMMAALTVASAFLSGREVRVTRRLGVGYVPDGLTAAEYERIKKGEKNKKDLSRGGARGFESRSLHSFVSALEAGDGKHLYPVNPNKVKKGEIPLKDVPYMQRGGSWTNSDLVGKKGWMKTGFGSNAFNDGKANSVAKKTYDKDYLAKKELEAKAKKQQDDALSPDLQMWRAAGALTPNQAKAAVAPKIKERSLNPEKKNKPFSFGFFSS